jgi:hypothetical protein
VVLLGGPEAVRRITPPTHDRQRLGIDRPEKPENAAARQLGPLMNESPVDEQLNIHFPFFLERSMDANPIVLQQLENWQRERIGQVCRRIELGLASGHVDRCFRILAEYEKASAESPPVESILDDRSAAVLRNRKVLTVEDLKAARGQLASWSEISDHLRKRIRQAIAQLD